MIKQIEQKNKKYTADMYSYDDGIDPKDLLNNKDVKPGKAKLFHDIAQVFKR